MPKTTENEDPTEKKKNRYVELITAIFSDRYVAGAEEVEFKRGDIEETADSLGIKLPKNLGDLIYSFRYRTELPKEITKTAPRNKEWIIRSSGRAKYKFCLTRKFSLAPNEYLVETKIPDATPGIIARYALDDEQALLAKVRFNRLIDLFTRLTCYSLQSHLRTTVPEMGQVETDEVYVGVDKNGAQYVIPVQAKGGTDKLGRVQIEQDFAMAKVKFPHLACRCIAAQFMANNVIALFELVETWDDIAIESEKHYRLVHPDEISDDELIAYRKDVV
jgi:hypothetical protein